MANYPEKIVDPTEAALSAIQEALKIRDDEDQPEDRPRRHRRATDRLPRARDRRDARVRSRIPSFDTDDRSAPATQRPRAFRAANDDQQSIGQVLQALQQPPGAHVLFRRRDVFRAPGSSAAWRCRGPIWPTSMPRSGPATRRPRS